MNEPRTLYECPSCGNLGIGDGEIRCCDGPMETARTDSAVDDPSLEWILRSVFDMSSTELDICLCVMEGGELTVKQLANDIGYDRSVVSRHLNHLSELGIIEKHRRLLERGGHTYVYTPVPPETVRERLRAAFYAWVQVALGELEELQREKVESIAYTGEEPAWQVYLPTEDA